MRILFLSRCPPYPLYLGDRLILGHLARHLHQRGHQLDLLSFYDRPGDPTEVEHYRDLFGHVQLLPEPPRSQRAYLRRLAGPLFPHRAAEAWSPEMWAALEGCLAQRYDVIHCFGGVQVYEYRNLIRAFPNLIVPYESYSLYLERARAEATSLIEGLLYRLKAQVARRFEAQMFRGFGAVVVLTEVDAAALRALRPDLPLRVIPNGVESDHFTPDPTTAPEPDSLVFVGNYAYPPNAEAARWLLQEIFPRVRAAIPTATLWLVGSEPPSDLMPGQGVTITGRVPDVRLYLARAALFIAPLRVGAGIKNKVLESMAMGKAVVGTPLSGDGIDPGQGEHIVYGQTAQELADAAIALLRDPARRERMGAANRALIQARFTWERVADAYERLYQILAAGRKATS